MRYLYAASAATIVLILVMVGCRQSSRPAAPAPQPAADAAQMHEISNGSNLIAKTAETVEVEADIHFADRPAPVRAKLRIRPGTWIVPEQMLDIRDGGIDTDTICNDTYCEVRP